MSKPPAGIVALTAFFVFGAVMSGLTALALLFPGGVLEPLWRLKPTARADFQSMGQLAIPLMSAVCLACVLAARGLWILAPWGRALALVILAANLAGDVANALLRGDLRTLIGVPIAGALSLWLLSPRTRALFQRP